MLKHVVMYKLKNPTPEILQKVKDNFLSMKGNIEVLKDINCGADVLHSARSYDFVLECTFERKEDLATYKAHPVHLPVKAYMDTVVETSKSVDYEF